MNYEKDSAENSIIQGLEALLCSDETETSNTRHHLKTNEDLKNVAWKEHSELSRDSAFSFSNVSFKNRHPVFNNLEYSVESRHSNQSFDPVFFSKPHVRNVSYDGCFIEGDSGIFLNQGRNTSMRQVLNEGHSVLSNAISHGGDLNSRHHTALGVQDVYTFTKYIIHLRKTWNNLCTLQQLWSKLQNGSDENFLPSELSLTSIVICLTSLITKLQQELAVPKLTPLLQDIRSYLELASTTARESEMNWKSLQHVSKTAHCLIVILTAEANARELRRSTPQDFFRSEKALQIWSNLA